MGGGVCPGCGVVPPGLGASSSEDGGIVVGTGGRPQWASIRRWIGEPIQSGNQLCAGVGGSSGVFGIADAAPPASAAEPAAAATLDDTGASGPPAPAVFEEVGATSDDACCVASFAGSVDGVVGACVAAPPPPDPATSAAWLGVVAPVCVVLVADPHPHVIP